MKKLLALACTLLLVAGCAGTPIDWNKARSVSVGMTENELIEKMGSPNTVSARGNRQVWVYVYVNGMTASSKTVSFIMQDGKVAEVPAIPTSFQ